MSDKDFSRSIVNVLFDRRILPSKSEVRRAIAQRAVRVDGVVVETSLMDLAPGLRQIQIGKQPAHLIEVFSADKG